MARAARAMSWRRRTRTRRWRHCCARRWRQGSRPRRQRAQWRSARACAARRSTPEQWQSQRSRSRQLAEAKTRKLLEPQNCACVLQPSQPCVDAAAQRYCGSLGGGCVRRGAARRSTEHNHEVCLRRVQSSSGAICRCARLSSLLLSRRGAPPRASFACSCDRRALHHVARCRSQPRPRRRRHRRSARRRVRQRLLRLRLREADMALRTRNSAR
jgi:hypothetical protein